MREDETIVVSMDGERRGGKQQSCSLPCRGWSSIVTGKCHLQAGAEPALPTVGRSRSIPSATRTKQSTTSRAASLLLTHPHAPMGAKGPATVLPHTLGSLH